MSAPAATGCACSVFLFSWQGLQITSTWNLSHVDTPLKADAAACIGQRAPAAPVSSAHVALPHLLLQTLHAQRPWPGAGECRA